MPSWLGSAQRELPMLNGWLRWTRQQAALLDFRKAGPTWMRYATDPPRRLTRLPRPAARAIAVILACAVAGCAGNEGGGPTAADVEERYGADFAVSDIGASPTEAGCTPPELTPVTGSIDHFPAGSELEDAYRQTHGSQPPTFGPHWDAPPEIGRNFYTVDDRPSLGQIVTHHEIGYTIVWYAEDADKIDLYALASLFSGNEPSDRLLVVPWTTEDAGVDDDAPVLPGGAAVALTHWTTSAGVRVYCDQLSGEVVGQFMSQFPAANSPAPDAI